LVGGNTQGQGVFGDEYDFQDDVAPPPPVVTPPPPVVTTTGTTATIGFWDSKNGKAVILSAGQNGQTPLAQWLTTKFPNLYGSAKLTDNLSVYTLFDTYKNANGTKTNAQVMATALAIYFSDPLIGQTPTSGSFGFNSSVANVQINVSNNAAFASGQTSVWDLLVATNKNASKGVISGGKGAQWTAVNDMFDSINQRFDTP
jgi:hypothetical protein